MRRLLMIALSLMLLLGLTAAAPLLAQDEPKKEAAKDDTKKDEPKKDETKKDEAKKEEPKKDETKKDEPKPEPPPTIPPEVEAKLEAARRAVAEAIVAAQDAGLVKTTIDPPPILDVLILGRADDADKLKGKTDANPEIGVSPEVFGAWFTGYGKMEGVTAEKNVRIVPPSKGLSDWYRSRAAILNRHIADVRKAKGEAPKPKEEPKKEEPKKEEPKDAPKDAPKEEAKKEEPKDAPKDAPKEEAKKEEPKKEEPKDAPKEEAKKEDAPK